MPNDDEWQDVDDSWEDIPANQLQSSSSSKSAHKNGDTKNHVGQHNKGGDRGGPSGRKVPKQDAMLLPKTGGTVPGYVEHQGFDFPDQETSLVASLDSLALAATAALASLEAPPSTPVTPVTPVNGNENENGRKKHPEKLNPNAPAFEITQVKTHAEPLYPAFKAQGLSADSNRGNSNHRGGHRQDLGRGHSETPRNKKGKEPVKSPHLYQSFVPAQNPLSYMNAGNAPSPVPQMVRDPSTGLYVTSLYVSPTESKNLSTSTSATTSFIGFEHSTVRPLLTADGERLVKTKVAIVASSKGSAPILADPAILKAKEAIDVQNLIAAQCRAESENGRARAEARRKGDAKKALESGATSKEVSVKSSSNVKASLSTESIESLASSKPKSVLIKNPPASSSKDSLDGGQKQGLGKKSPNGEASSSGDVPEVNDKKESRRLKDQERRARKQAEKVLAKQSAASSSGSTPIPSEGLVEDQKDSKKNSPKEASSSRDVPEVKDKKESRRLKDQERLARKQAKKLLAKQSAASSSGSTPIPSQGLVDDKKDSKKNSPKGEASSSRDVPEVYDRKVSRLYRKEKRLARKQAEEALAQSVASSSESTPIPSQGLVEDKKDSRSGKDQRAAPKQGTSSSPESIESPVESKSNPFKGVLIKTPRNDEASSSRVPEMDAKNLARLIEEQERLVQMQAEQLLHQEPVSAPALQKKGKKSKDQEPISISNSHSSLNESAHHDASKMVESSRKEARKKRHEKDGIPAKNSHRRVENEESNTESGPSRKTTGKGPKDRGQKSERKPKKDFFEEYYTREIIDQGLEAGTLFQGKLRVNKANRQDAYVTCPESNLTDDVYIPGSRLQNRSFDGDVVIVELLDGASLAKELAFEKGKKEQKMMEGHERQKKVEIEQLEVPVFEHVETRTFGKVVCIVESNSLSRVFVGTLAMDKFDFNKPKNETNGVANGTVESKDGVSNWIWFKPNDKKAPLLIIPREIAPKEFLDNPAEFSTILVTAAVRKWNVKSQYPFGEYIGKLGQIGELGVESKALLAAGGVTWDDFSEDVLACLPATPWTIPEEEYAKRLDLRSERIFSIDPQTARDLDDALSFKVLPDGNYEIGVHIADVSHFVKPGTALDREAHYRATTVYLTQKAIPMLPRLLCEQLCSLNNGVDRLAFTVLWIFSPDGEIVGTPRFSRSIIRSCAKLSYEHAQATIEGRSWDGLPLITLSNDVTKAQVDTDILNLFNLSKILRKKRYDGGALSIHSIKLWFSLDEVGNPVKTGVYEIKDSNRLVEEFMLLANMAVAQKISSSFPENSLLRRHQPPVPRALEQFIEMATARGFSIDASSSFSLNQSFERIENPLHRYLLRLLCIKAMKRADYYSTGAVDISAYSHYALSVPLYTHFTSPIRRYCDLVVHRELEWAISGKLEDNHYSCKAIEEIAKQCNDRKSVSKDCQDASQHLYLCTYLSRLQNLPPFKDALMPGIVAFAHVNVIGTRSFDVVVDSLGIEKRVWLEDMIANSEELVGCKSIENNHYLVVYWRRKEGDSEPSQSIPAITEVNEINELSNELDAVTLDEKKPNGKESNGDASGLDPSKSKVQVIQMFSRVQVRIVADMTMSPPMYRLFPVYPDFKLLAQQSEIDASVLFSDNPALSESSATKVSCPGIDDAAD